MTKEEIALIEKELRVGENTKIIAKGIELLREHKSNIVDSKIQTPNRYQLSIHHFLIVVTRSDFEMYSQDIPAITITVANEIGSENLEFIIEHTSLAGLYKKKPSKRKRYEK